MEQWQLKQMQLLPLEVKILKSQQRIREWYEHFNGQVYVSFSGGKDSTVLLHLVRDMYPDVAAVFVDTGLEYPEIRDFVKSIQNVTIIRPVKNFRQVINECGYPVISKDVSRKLRYADKGSQWAINDFEGLNKDGTISIYKQRYKKYKYLQSAPFKTSDECCSIMKEKPFRNYEKKSGTFPFIGLLAVESKRRLDSYLMTGCNAYNSSLKSSKPMAFWTEQDVLNYILKNKLTYASVYGEIVNENDELTLTGVKRTGCMFCMFGVHLEKGENRFQRMAKTHPKIHDYCINKLGIGEVLDYINVAY